MSRFFFANLAVPSPLSGFPKINPTQKQCQLFMTQHYLVLRCVWLRPMKASLLKPFCANPQASRIPENDLQPITLCVRKQKEMATQGVAQQLIAHQTIQTIKPFAHVRCPRRQVDPRSRAHSEHGLRSFQNADQLLQYSSIEST